LRHRARIARTPNNFVAIKYIDFGTFCRASGNYFADMRVKYNIAVGKKVPSVGFEFSGLT